MVDLTFRDLFLNFTASIIVDDFDKIITPMLSLHTLFQHFCVCEEMVITFE